MLIQILTHTPLYVWAILAMLVLRGVIAMRDREMAFWKLFIIPLVMLALTGQDIAGKFGMGGMAMAAWAVGSIASALLVWQFSAARIVPAATPGMVVVRGSWKLLALLMGVFFTKYAAAVLLAMLPHARQDLVVAAAVAGVFGIFNGIFLGRLGRDVTSYLQAQADFNGAAA